MFIETKSTCPSCKKRKKKVFLCESVFFQSIDSEKYSHIYPKITAKFIAGREGDPISWRLKSKGFKCPKCRFVPKENFNARGRIKLDDPRLLNRLGFSSYKVKEVILYKYEASITYETKKEIFSDSQKKRRKRLPEKVGKFSGVLWTTTPRIKTNVFLQSYLEKKSIDPNFIVVSKTMEGMHDFRECYLVKTHEFLSLNREELRTPIIFEPIQQNKKPTKR